MHAFNNQKSVNIFNLLPNTAIDIAFLLYAVDLPILSLSARLEIKFELHRVSHFGNVKLKAS